MPLNISRNHGKITIQYDQEVKRFSCVCALILFAVTICQYLKQEQQALYNGGGGFSVCQKPARLCDARLSLKNWQRVPNDSVEQESSFQGHYESSQGNANQWKIRQSHGDTTGLWCAARAGTSQSSLIKLDYVHQYLETIHGVLVTNVDKMIAIRIRIIITITGGQPEIFNNNRTQQSTGSCLSLGRNPSQVQKQMVYCEGWVKKMKKKHNGKQTPHCK